MSLPVRQVRPSFFGGTMSKTILIQAKIDEADAQRLALVAKSRYLEDNTSAVIRALIREAHAALCDPFVKAWGNPPQEGER